MALKLEDKQAIVSEVAAVAACAYSAVAAEYRGMSVGQMTNLRAKARENGVYVKVVKNTLARRAVDGTDFACMKEGLVGPLVLAFSQEDPGGAARLARDFAKDSDKFVVRLVALGGKLIAPADLDRVANMPTRDQAIAMLMGVMKAPIEKLVRTMAEPHAKLVRTVAAIRDQKQQAAA